MRSLFLLAPIVLLSGCATPETAFSVALPDAVAQEAQHQEQMINAGKQSRYQNRAPASSSNNYPIEHRIFSVAERVLIAAAPYCGNHVTPAYAVSVAAPDYGPPVVLNSSGSLREGDRVLTINGEEVPGGQNGWAMLNQYGAQLARSGQPITLTATRGRQKITAQYPVVQACAYNVAVQNNNQWNAFADGETVHIEAKLAQDVTNDDDLAFVVAHELAHNVLTHVSKQQQNVMTGAVAGLAVEALIAGLGGGSMNGEIAQMGGGLGGMQYSQDFEREADYVGLYILAGTGYDLEAGPRIARRIAEQNPQTIRYGTSHPSSAERAASLQATIREIQQKMSAGQPLVPNMAPKG